MLEIPNNNGVSIQCDVNKNYVDNELKKKVDIVEGKNLSTNDYTNEDKMKLISLNNYTHPKTHDATIIKQNITHRFVTDEEKAMWTAKSDEYHNHDDVYYTKSQIDDKISNSEKPLVVNWNDIQNKPVQFNPTSHKHIGEYFQTYSQGNVSNFNSDTKEGKYFVNSEVVTNAPYSGRVTGVLLNYHGDRNSIIQLFINDKNGALYTRTYNTTTKWTSWYSISLEVLQAIELIDTTMLAVDEMFVMIEPLLPQTMILKGGESKMIDMYVAMIIRGLKTIDEIPVRYRQQVKNILEKLEK